ncbi:MAG: GNAT family N-acetyltransferase [Pseudomonadota bacterium]
MQLNPAKDQAERQACFDIRRAVFIEEQNIPEAEEWDTHDESAVHVLARVGDAAAGTARVIVDGATAKIGRVAVLVTYRSTGLGFALLKASEEIAREAGCAMAVLDAQVYAVGFYERLGFVAEGDAFDDGSGILHLRMRKALTEDA